MSPCFAWLYSNFGGFAENSRFNQWKSESLTSSRQDGTPEDSPIALNTTAIIARRESSSIVPVREEALVGFVVPQPQQKQRKALDKNVTNEELGIIIWQAEALFYSNLNPA